MNEARINAADRQRSVLRSGSILGPVKWPFGWMCLVALATSLGLNTSSVLAQATAVQPSQYAASDAVGKQESAPLAKSAALKTWIARQAELQATVAKVTPAVVAITDGQSFGSGVIISKDGLILTAGHVIIEPDREFQVMFPDGRVVDAKPLGKNLNVDAGMAKITEDNPDGWPFVDVGTDNSVRLGNWVVAMGHSGGYDLGRTPPVRLGRLLRWDREAFTSDCSIIGGDSGGPLFNLQGQLIGIHSSIGDSIAENRHVSIGMFLRDWDRLESGESWGTLPGTEPPKRRRDRGDRSGNKEKDADSKSEKPDADDSAEKSSPIGNAALGVDVDRSDRQAIIRNIKPNSAAARVGLQVGDIILEIDGVQIGSPTGLVRQIANRRAGESVKVRIQRKGSTLDYQIILGEL